MRRILAIAVLSVFVLPLSAQKPKPLSEAERIAKEGMRTADVFLTVHGKERLEIRNAVAVSLVELTIRAVGASDEKRIGFISWNKEGAATLADDLKNTYSHFPQEVDGEIGGYSLYSDVVGVCRLVFERPVPKAKALTLELTGDNISSKGRFALTLERTRTPGEWTLKKAKP